ncbi:MAG: CPBP family intramembrane glutamic endopeptidase [Candidatus Hodarchaeota archaeon]
MQIKICSKCGKHWVAEPKSLLCPDCGTITLVEAKGIETSSSLKSRHKALPKQVIANRKKETQAKQQVELEYLLKRLEKEAGMREKIIQGLVDMGYLTSLINVVLALIIFLPAIILLLTNTSLLDPFNFSFRLYDHEFVLFEFEGIFFLPYLFFLVSCVILSIVILRQQTKKIFKDNNLGLSIGSWLVYFETPDSKSVLILITEMIIINGAVSMWSLILFGVFAPTDVFPTSSFKLDPGIANEIFLLLNASVYEEIISRFTLIGIPVFIGTLMIPKKRQELTRSTFWKPLVGGFGIKHHNIKRMKGDVIWRGFIIFLIIGSAIIFGLNHVPSWGWWKFVPTFLGGLFLGYLFVEYGIHAAILLHFFIDFPLVSLTLAWEVFFWGVEEGMLDLLGLGPFYILFYLTGLYILYGSLSLVLLWPIVTGNLISRYYNQLVEKRAKKDTNTKPKEEAENIENEMER